jgi:enoyl-CoA hydratase/carnithine racemase
VADDPRAAAHELAERIAHLPALAVRAIKRAGRFEGPLDAGLGLERDLFVEVAGSADAREGADAFLEKRRPEFAHR